MPNTDNRDSSDNAEHTLRKLRAHSGQEKGALLLPNYTIITCGHNEPITAENNAEAIKAAKKYAERYNLHGYIVMNNKADIIFTVEQDPKPQTK